jgi:hypothetical protein
MYDSATGAVPCTQPMTGQMTRLRGAPEVHAVSLVKLFRRRSKVVRSDRIKRDLYSAQLGTAIRWCGPLAGAPPFAKRQGRCKVEIAEAFKTISIVWMMTMITCAIIAIALMAFAWAYEHDQTSPSSRPNAWELTATTPFDDPKPPQATLRGENLYVEGEEEPYFRRS